MCAYNMMSLGKFSVLSLILNNIYSADQPTSPHTSVTKLAGDKTNIASKSNLSTAVQHLQNHIKDMERSYSNWKIKTNDHNRKLFPCWRKKKLFTPIFTVKQIYFIDFQYQIRPVV